MLLLLSIVNFRLAEPGYALPLQKVLIPIWQLASSEAFSGERMYTILVNHLEH